MFGKSNSQKTHRDFIEDNFKDRAFEILESFPETCLYFREGLHLQMSLMKLSHNRKLTVKDWENLAGFEQALKKESEDE